MTQHLNNSYYLLIYRALFGLQLHAYDFCFLFIGSGIVTLIPNSTIDENTQVCPGQVLEYHCRSDRIQDQTIRWFLCSDSSNCDREYGFLRAPQVTPPIEIPPTGGKIPGVVITLDAFMNFGSANNSFASTLTVNTSEFDYRRVLIFKCGSFAERSNPLTLNFTIKCKLCRHHPVHDGFSS